MMYPIKRTPEQGHTKRCLAKAFTTVVENWRDDDSVTDTEFSIHLQAGGVRTEVYEYLGQGLVECLCDPIPDPDIFNHTHATDCDCGYCDQEN